MEIKEKLVEIITHTHKLNLIEQADKILLLLEEENKHIIEEAVSKYWYDTEYTRILNLRSYSECEESRQKLRKWLDENLKLFIPKE